MSDSIAPVDSSSGDALGRPTFRFNSQSAFYQAHDFVLNHPEFHDNSTVNIYQNWIKTGELEAIRKWLNAPDPSTNFISALDKRAAGTGTWILRHQTYLNWKVHGRRLWIQGKVGSGKTILLTAIIKDLQPGVIYFYFDKRDNTKKKSTYRGFLLSLLMQAASNHEGVNSLLQEQYDKCKKGLNQLETEDLKTTLIAVIQGAKVFIVVDGMDECDELDLVIDLLLSLPDDCHVVATSRFDPQDSMRWLKIKLETESVWSDIKLYIETTLAKWPLSSELHDEVLSSLINGAKGQFRWVDCQIRTLQALKAPKAIHKALARLPKDLEAIYLETLQKIDDEDSVHQIFIWLLYAYEPLKLNQVADILAIDLEEEKFDPKYRPLELQNGLHNIVDSTFVVIDSVRGEKLD
ncbi:hypothetical protein GYMLUDRAFT_594800 [Collybiopsis luxurians FD-317 M1]|uniref:Nephrocystin 3-like N-terminal domain-containing protein n=1 Tax=Collybiopsis luxurians FD-317 M1 TaxID=944289 RepID=A0A0D0CE30_9AGAR|nr:hypothetical protein GYMLUDRAFT_594800 [Collybiopsis luxurians FD-317 M1]